MLKVDLNGTWKVLAPGATISGNLSWQTRGKTSKKTQYHLFLLWFTEGAGNTDVGIIAAETFVSSEKNGRRPFTFVIPSGPESFKGKLIHLRWAIEARSDQSETERVEFDVSSRDRPIDFES